jgi:hypothetical protein
MTMTQNLAVGTSFKYCSSSSAARPPSCFSMYTAPRYRWASVASSLPRRIV